MGLRFGTLWFGNEPTLLQKLSWNSYIYHGHELNIYLYDMSIDVPSGAIKKDANDIILEKDIFLPKFNNPDSGKGHAQFSDIFKIYMLKKTGLIWTDSDVVCLNDHWPNPEPYLLGFIGDSVKINYKNNNNLYIKNLKIINGDVLYIGNKKLIDEIIDEFESFPIIYEENEVKTGPELLTNLMIKHNLMHFVKETEIFHPVNYVDAPSFIKPEDFEKIMNKMDNSLAIALFYNSWIRHHVPIPKINSIPNENTVIGYLTKKYLGNNLVS